MPNSVPATIESPSFNWYVPFLPLTTRPPSGSIIASFTFSASPWAELNATAPTAIPAAIPAIPNPNVAADAVAIADIAATAISTAQAPAAVTIVHNVGNIVTANAVPTPNTTGYI